MRITCSSSKGGKQTTNQKTVAQHLTVHLKDLSSLSYCASVKLQLYHRISVFSGLNEEMRTAGSGRQGDL